MIEFLYQCERILVLDIFRRIGYTETDENGDITAKIQKILTEYRQGEGNMRHLRISGCFCRIKNSLFARIFMGLLLLSLGMVLLMGFWMNNIISQNYRKQAALSGVSRLKQTDESMELIINVLGQNMAQMMWSNDFITYMVSPGRVAPERDYRIGRQLKSIGSGSELVQSAYLYSPLTGEVRDSESIFQAEEFEDWPILREHLEKQEPKL